MENIARAIRGAAINEKLRRRMLNAVSNGDVSDCLVVYDEISTCVNVLDMEISKAKKQLLRLMELQNEAMQAEYLAMASILQTEKERSMFFSIPNKHKYKAEDFIGLL